MRHAKSWQAFVWALRSVLLQQTETLHHNRVSHAYLIKCTTVVGTLAQHNLSKLDMLGGPLC